MEKKIQVSFISLSHHLQCHWDKNRNRDIILLTSSIQVSLLSRVTFMAFNFLDSLTKALTRTTFVCTKISDVLKLRSKWLQLLIRRIVPMLLLTCYSKMVDNCLIPSPPRCYRRYLEWGESAEQYECRRKALAKQPLLPDFIRRRTKYESVNYGISNYWST